MEDSSTSCTSTILGQPSSAKKPKKNSIKGDTVQFRQQRKRKNMNIDEVTVNVLPPCPSNCSTKSSTDDRQIIWDDFRSLNSNNQRYRYLSQLIKITTPKRVVVSQKNRKSKRDKTIKYYLKGSAAPEEETNDNLLCKTCFMKVFRVTESKVRTIVSKKQENGQSPDITYKRGKHEPKSKVSIADKEEASLFLLSVPSYESHYGRCESSKKYLPDFHTKSSLFQDFKSAYPNNRVNFTQFRLIFHELNLSIKSKSCDTCKTCDSPKVCVDTAATEEIRMLVIAEQKAHWAKWRSAVEAKKLDSQSSKLDPSIIPYNLEQDFSKIKTTSARPRVQSNERLLYNDESGDASIEHSDTQQSGSNLDDGSLLMSVEDNREASMDGDSYVSEVSGGQHPIMEVFIDASIEMKDDIGSDNVLEELESKYSKYDDNYVVATFVYDKSSIFAELKEIYGPEAFRKFNDKNHVPRNEDEDILMRVLDAFRPNQPISDLSPTSTPAKTRKRSFEEQPHKVRKNKSATTKKHKDEHKNKAETQVKKVETKLKEAVERLDEQETKVKYLEQKLKRVKRGIII